MSFFHQIDHETSKLIIYLPTVHWYTELNKNLLAQANKIFQKIMYERNITKKIIF